MSNKNFSVDDILYEYSKKREEVATSKQEIDIDGFITSASSKTEETPKSKAFEVNIDYSRDSYENSEPNEDYLSTIKKEPATSRNSANTFAHENSEHKKQTHARAKQVQAEQLEKAALSFGANINPNSSSPEVKPLKPIRKSSGNTEIIEGLLKMKRERVASKTAELIPINRKNIKDIHLEITSKILPRTEQIPITTDMSEEEKAQYLYVKRHKKIRDFVLSAHDGEDDFDDAEFSETQRVELDDFSKIEDAPLIFKDIIQLKATLYVRLIILLITGVFGTYLSMANDFSLPVIGLFNSTTNPVAFLFINAILGIISAFVSYTVIAGGFSKILKLEADSDSILAVSVVTCIAANLLMLFNTDLFQRNKLHLYIPIAIAALIFNTIGKIMIVKRTERNFRLVSGDGEKYVLFQVDDEERAERFTKGALSDFPSLSAMRKTEFVTDFMRNSYASDMSDKLCKYVVPVVLAFAALATMAAVFLNSFAVTTLDKVITAVTTFSATACICSSFALMLASSYPISKASKKYLESSAAIIGYPAIEEFSETNSVLIDAGQLFPEGTVDFVNLKQLSSASIEDGILIAASLACHAGSILKPAFYKMLKGKTEMLYPVESYIYEDTLGLSGWIDNKRVLLGTRELMANHSIEGLPNPAKEKDYAKGNLVLYLSISGEVTTMFIIRLKTSLGISKWLREFENQDVTIVLRSIDAIVSLNFLSELFDVSPDVFKLLPFKLHKSFEEEVTYTSRISSPLICSGKFQSFALLVSGMKKLNKTISIGMVISLASIGLGGILAIILAATSSLNQLTPSTMLIYSGVWLFLMIAVQCFRKN